MSTARRHVLVVEDDSRYRRALHAVLVGAGLEPTFAGSVRETLSALAGPAFEVCLVDLGLPDGDGVELIRRLSRGSAAPPIIVISVATEERRILDALRAGATGYLFKEDAGRVAQAIEEAFDGGAPMSPRVARIVLHELRAGQDTAPTSTSASLTRREKEVVQLLAKGLSYSQVGTALSVSANTVRTHVRSIYDKLAVSTKTEAVLEALRLGVIVS